MAIKITRACDPIEVKQLTVVLYAPPGSGKTSMGFTADKPLLLDFDAGAYRAGNRRDSVQITSWGDVEGMTSDDLADYSTIVVDTAGRALDALTADIIRCNPKHGRGGSLTLQGYGELKSRFVAWTKLLHSFGKDVVLLTHMDEQRSGDEIIERLDVQGGSKGEIYKAADAMGRIQMVQGRKFGMLNFSPSDTAFGKNPAQFEPLAIPDFSADPDFLAGVIAGIKAKLNEAGAAQIAEQKRVEALRESFAKLESAEAFNAHIEDMADASPKDKALLVSVGESKGFEFDKKARAFKASEAA